MRAAWHGREVILDLRQGDLLVAHPGAWLKADGASAFSSLAVVYGDRFLRCSHRPWGMHRAPLGPPPHWCHSMRPPSPILNALLVAVLAVDHGDGGAIDALAVGRALAIATIVEIVRDLHRPEPHGERSRRTWEAMCLWMEEQLHRDVGRGEVARAVGITPNHATRLFARFSSRGFLAHLTELRLARARDLLVGSGHPVATIAAGCGMSTHRLIRSFKRRFGTTPGVFRSRTRH
ncbi:MAG: helix-turn-helix transcriptional regulator [Planctomycetes bacterium]|nr:helix-turn-helix transcriptional regulator [Planctomycetota bacterium]